MTASYERSGALNWSTLKHLAVSGKLLRHRAAYPQHDTPSYRVGRAIHCAVLEPERLPERYVHQPDFGPMQSAKNRATRDEWKAGLGEGVDVLTDDEFDLLGTCAVAVTQHQPAADLLDGTKREVSAYWARDGVACRGRIDAAASDRVVDLKTTRAENLRLFLRDFARYLYHGQLAWYLDGARRSGLAGEGAAAYVIAVQTVEPYDVIAARLSPVTLATGDALCTRLLDEYRACQAVDRWPGMAPDLIELDLPSWADGGDGGGEW